MLRRHFKVFDVLTTSIQRRFNVMCLLVYQRKVLNIISHFIRFIYLSFNLNIVYLSNKIKNTATIKNFYSIPERTVQSLAREHGRVFWRVLSRAGWAQIQHGTAAGNLQI